MEQTTLFIIVFYSVIYIIAVIIICLHNAYLQYQLALRAISGFPFHEKKHYFNSSFISTTFPSSFLIL